MDTGFKAKDKNNKEYPCLSPSVLIKGKDSEGKDIEIEMTVVRLDDGSVLFLDKKDTTIYEKTEEFDKDGNLLYKEVG